MVAQNVFFYLIAAVMVASAVAVVTTKNVVHAAVYLVVVFAGVAATYLLLAAEFVAVTQILLYIGAIMVLMLFGIMLTRARIGREIDLTHDHWYVGLVTAVLLVGVTGYALVEAFGDDPLPADLRVDQVADSNAATVSDTVFSQYLVPFEVVSVLLLAALVGAIVIARKDR
ncbi:MAG: NADH-quinone oxidoreductase subunit J [Acidimicrobiia bacterium]